MIFRQFFDHDSSTYTYLIADSHTGDAAFIDPVKEHLGAYQQILRELNLTLRYALDTHIHADHITCLGDLREATGCMTVMGSGTEAVCVSHVMQDQETLALGGLNIKGIATPGHTPESFTFILGKLIFTGDTLLIRGCGRTDFQNGSSAELYKSHQKLLALPDDSIVYPGHDYKGWTSSTIGEERQHNTRLQLPEADFIYFMNNLELPDPRLMDIAVNANQHCGQA